MKPNQNHLHLHEQENSKKQIDKFLSEKCIEMSKCAKAWIKKQKFRQIVEKNWDEKMECRCKKTSHLFQHLLLKTTECTECDSDVYFSICDMKIHEKTHWFHCHYCNECSYWNHWRCGRCNECQPNIKWHCFECNGISDVYSIMNPNSPSKVTQLDQPHTSDDENDDENNDESDDDENENDDNDVTDADVNV
eukprot:471737_1